MFPTPPSNASLPGHSGVSSKLPNVYEFTNGVSSTSQRSSRNSDDTSELSGLYQLLSSQDVIKPGRHVGFFPTPSIAVSHKHGSNSSHQDLATMLAELAGPRSRRVSPSSSRTSTAWAEQMQAASPGEQGKCHRNIRIVDIL